MDKAYNLLIKNIAKVLGYHFCDYLTLYKTPSYQGSFADFKEGSCQNSWFFEEPNDHEDMKSANNLNESGSRPSGVDPLDEKPALPHFF